MATATKSSQAKSGQVKAKRRRAKAPAGGLARYLELVRAHPLRPIRSAAGLERAVAVLNRLIDRGTSPARRAASIPGGAGHPDRALRGRPRARAEGRPRRHAPPPARRPGRHPGEAGGRHRDLGVDRLGDPGGQAARPRRGIRRLFSEYLKGRPGGVRPEGGRPGRGCPEMPITTGRHGLPRRRRLPHRGHPRPYSETGRSSRAPDDGSGLPTGPIRIEAL